MTEQTTKAPSLSGQVRLRPATDTDVNFIFNSWLKCYRMSPNTQGTENPVFYAQHHLLIEGLCKSASITVACNDADISQIYGYCCSEKIDGLPIIHFLYVKEIYRKFGVGALLAGEAGWEREKPVFYTHRTKTCKPLQEKFPMVYNPYLAYYAYGVGKAESKAPQDSGA